MTATYAAQARVINGTGRWETRTRTHAKNGEAIALESMRIMAEHGPQTMEFRAIEMGRDGDYSNPVRVLGVRSGIVPVVAS